MPALKQLQNNTLYLVLFGLLSLSAMLASTAPALAGLMQESGAVTLNIDALVNPDALFRYANLMIAALAGIVLVIIGFKLASIIIRWIMMVFDNFRI